jgi:hypothetical protein
LNRLAVDTSTTSSRRRETLFASRGQRHARDVELAVAAAEKAFAG